SAKPAQIDSPLRVSRFHLSSNPEQDILSKPFSRPPPQERCMRICPTLLKKMLGFFYLVLAVVCPVATVDAQVGIVPMFDRYRPQPQPETITLGNGIEYHGGPIMPGPHNVYFIWYGHWSGDTATAILPDFITGLNGSLYFNINTTYGTASDN